MNDISVKIEETPNEKVQCFDSVPEQDSSEKDPLAIGLDDVAAAVPVVKKEVIEDSENCVGVETKDINDDCEKAPVVPQTRLIKEELIKEETVSINSSLDESDILCGVEIDDNEISSLAGSPLNKEVNPEPENCIVATEEIANQSTTTTEINKEINSHDIPVEKLDNSENTEVIKNLGVEQIEEKSTEDTFAPIITEIKTEAINKDDNVIENPSKHLTEVVELNTNTNTETEIVCVQKTVEIVCPNEISETSENIVPNKQLEEPVVAKVKNVEEIVPVVKEAKSNCHEKKSIERIISDLEKQSALQIKPLKRPAEEIATVPQKRLLLDKQVRQKEKTLPTEEKSVPVFEKNTNLDPKVVDDNKLKKKELLDVDVIDMKEDKTEDKVKTNDTKALNGDCLKEETSKRRGSEDSEIDSPLKKLCLEIEKSYPGHDGMLTDYIQSTTKNNVDEIQRHTEQLLAEIQTLRELAQKKEHEWNNILHLKKVKEEILLRLLRQKQVLAFEKSVEINGADRPEPFEILNQHKGYAIDKSDEISGVSIKPQCNPMQAPVMPVSSHYSPMSVLPPPYDKAAHMHNMQKGMYPGPMMMPTMPTMPGFPRDMNGQMPNFSLPMGRQGPTKDVKSIIADYRQRNPDLSPRRGRRMKSILNPNMMNPHQNRPHHPKGVEGLNSMNSLNNLGMIFNNLDMNQKAMLERLSQMQTTTLPNGLSFKDVLVQFANMQPQNMQPQNVQTQNILIRPEMVPNRPDHHSNHTMRTNDLTRNMGRRMEKPSEEVHLSMKSDSRHASPSPRLPPPPPYPEISLLPVANSNSHDQASMATQNSLLHGILTKQGSSASQSFSPTLAKLLTSPERKQTTLPSFGQAKNCGEITITPVQPTPPPQTVEPAPVEKPEEVVQLDEEETVTSEGSGCGSGEGEERRLVIDEGTEEAPLCQGCRRRDAQFVCAGCANQWYCSRDCQVAAWDEHSDMCSG